MKNICAFILMDLETVRPYLKSAVLVLAIGIAMGFILQSVLLPALMILLLFVMFSAYPFAVAEKNGMDTLYATLPLGRRAAVAGRYLFAAVILLVGMLAALGLAYAIDAVYSDFAPAQTALLIAAFTSAGFVILSLQYPIYFRFGYSKAKLAAMLPMLLLAVCLALFGTILPDFSQSMAQLFSSPVFAAVVPLAALSILILSVLLSCRIYAARDL